MKKLIVANWKMYLTLRQSVTLAKSFLPTTSYLLHTQIVLCPSFVALEEVAKIVRKIKNIKLGAQDVTPERHGAFTGEVGLDDLRELGVEYVLVGHSERRRYFKETDTVVNRKLRAVLKVGMGPILCVGEPWNIRRAGKAQSYVEKQLHAGLRGVRSQDLKRVTVAYEPVWAIGTGRADSPKDASSMHSYIRKVVGVKSMPILYGGSVNSSNAKGFLREVSIDGLLIGKASTNFNEFSKIMS